jgi:pSer/pThr/pTyr-binding forkhead associated (FHA) protein
MFFLMIGLDRTALPIGESFLGGGDNDALPIAEFAAKPRTAMVAVTVEGSATITCVGDGVVLVDGKPVGARPVVLVHGSKLVVAGVRMLVADVEEGGSTDNISGITDAEVAAFATLGAGEPTADTGGRLLRSDGRAIDIPATGLLIGRDPSCDVVLTGKAVSRKHATIRPSLQGYVVVNSGSNATIVNGRQIDESQVLRMNDVIRIGDEELTFVADAASFESVPVSAAEQAASSATPAGNHSPNRRPPATLFATLEGLNEGVLKGVRFRIERPVAHIGRGQHNDVRIKDGSVSASHATLTRRGGSWVVLDLGSTNGTYVEGERIAGERRLTGVTELRFGNVKLMFRPIAGGGDDDASTRALVGVPDDGS